MIFREEHFSEEEYRSVALLVESRGDCTGRNPDGTFGANNDCQEDGDGPSGISREPSAGAKERTPTAKTKPARGGGDDGDIRLGNVRRQDVMLRGGKSVIVSDAEAKERARKDRDVNPMPEGSPPGSTADLYDRTFVTRDDPKRPLKITSHDQVFDASDLTQNGTYVSHESVARFLSARHEDDRKAIGVDAPEAIIDTRAELPPEQFEYVVEALKRDVDRAYSEGRNPGFYSTDIAECMEIMSGFYPELSNPDEAKRMGTTPEDASFVFTMITAITSNGTDPALNLESADRIYRLYREHGSIRTPDEIMGGDRAREIKNSLNRLQDMIDEFGEARVRSLMSGVTHASSINLTMKRLAKKSQEIGGSWSEKGLGSSELADEVVPVAAIFGPKIGSFFANLSGRHQFLTMDRWLMRSVGRVTGELITRSTPEAANKQANEAIKAIKARSRSKDILFGVDKPPLNLTREDVIKSLELQARSGIVEEYGAAYEWAKAAARAYSKVPRGLRDGKPYGSFGVHEDPQIRAAHAVGNAMSKSLVHEQQDPRSARARRVLRGVFREVAKRVAADNPDTRGGVEVSEIQAVLWQYEQNLWKRLGAKTKIEGDSLYSAAAKALKQRRDSGDEPTSLRPEKTRRPKSVRSADAEEYETAGEVEADHPNQSGQDLWDSEIETSGLDFMEFIRAFIEEGDFDRDEESRDVVVLSNPSPESVAGEIRDASRVVIRSASHSVWPRLGFDAKIPQEIRSLLPEHLSHASTLLDLHATREGAEWWNANGRDVDMELDLRDSSAPPAKVFFRCLNSDLTSLDSVWEEIWESDDLDDYCGDEQTFFATESRDCGQDDLGRFSSGNDCANDDGVGGGIAEDIPPSAKQASKTGGGSGGKTAKRDAWKKKDDTVVLSASQSKVLAPVKSALVAHGRLVSESLDYVGVTLDEAASVCADLADDSVVLVTHGDTRSLLGYVHHSEPLSGEVEPEVTFCSNRSFAGVENGLGTIVSIARNDEGELSLNYALLGIKPEAQKASPVAIAREMYRGVFESISNAEKIGVKEIVMKATGDAKDSKFKGYRIWPRLGFDGVIPRNKITPTYSLKWGFFDAYGSSLPDSALSPRAKKERAAGSLTIQALYETKEGQDWWEKHGGTMDMIMRVGDEDNPGWQRYKKISSRVSGRSVDFEAIIEAEWRSIREEVETRSDDCGRDEGGRFGQDNKCQEDAAPGSEQTSGPASKTYDEIAREMDLKRVRSDIGAGNHGSASRNISLMLEKSTPSEVARSLGFEKFDLDGSFSEDTRKARGSFFTSFGKAAVDTAARHLASLSIASGRLPELKKAHIDFSTQRNFISTMVKNSGAKGVLDRLRVAMSSFSAMAICNLTNGDITLVQNKANSQETLDSAYGKGWFSTNDPSHYIVHEYAHRLQSEGLRSYFVSQIEKSIRQTEKALSATGEFALHGDSIEIAKMSIEKERLELSELKAGRPLTQSEISDYYASAHFYLARWGARDRINFESSVKSVSTYGRSHALELAAEYWSSVTLGFRDNSDDLDAFCEAIHMPKPKKQKKATR